MVRAVEVTADEQRVSRFPLLEDKLCARWSHPAGGNASWICYVIVAEVEPGVILLTKLEIRRYPDRNGEVEKGHVGRLQAISSIHKIDLMKVHFCFLNPGMQGLN